jgi:hypothetical protein
MKAGTERRAACCELVQDVARSAGEVHLTVTGASMLPAVWPGDRVTVRSCALTDLEPGQIAVFQEEDRFVIHRVTSVTRGRLVTQGDSRDRIDAAGEPEQIVGRVVSISRDGRAVDCEQTGWQRAAAAILRRSHLLRRLAVFVHRRVG